MDLTETNVQDQSREGIFSTIEDIKDEFIAGTIYRKYIEAIFEKLIVLVFTNENLDE